MAETKTKTVVVNLISGPGSGKSTAMAGIFYGLKKLGVSCEMAPEFAKEKVWDEAYRVMDDQLYVFAKQRHKLWRLNGKVRIIITDGSLLNSLVYDKENLSQALHDLVLEEFNKFENINFYIKRSYDKYETDGRLESAEESSELDNEYIRVMDEAGIEYTKVRNIDAADYVIKVLTQKGIID